MVNRVFWGMILIAIGVFFILDQRDIIDFDLVQIFTTYWPIILIYFGLKGLIFQYKWGHGVGFGYLWPLLLTIIGVYFLGHNIDYIHMSAGDFFQYIIPFLLIVIGLLIVLKPGRKPSATDDHDAAGVSEAKSEPYETNAEPYEPNYEPHEPNYERYEANDKPYVDAAWEEVREHHERASEAPEEAYAVEDNDKKAGALALREEERSRQGTKQERNTADERPENHFSFIGDIHIGSANWRLRPLNVNHLIGDTVIDLTRATIPDGLTKIHVGCIIGDVKILLPKDEDVEPSVTMTSIMGEFNMFGKRDDSMFKTRREESAHYPTAKKQLQIMANVLIGDLRIERV